MKRRFLSTLFLGVAASALAAAPQRVVSLGGDLTEIAFALNRGDRIIAVDLTSTFPEPVRRLPRVGYVRALSAEGILAMKPDLILASADAGPAETMAQLRNAGIPIVTVAKTPTLAGIQEKIATVAEALDATDEGQKLATSFDGERREAERAAQDGAPVPAIFVMARGDGALIGAGRDTAAHTMLEAAGLRNVLADVPGYKPVSAESLVALAPAVIVTGERTVQACGGLDRFKQNPALQPTPAVQADQVLVFDDMYLLGLGPRAARAVGELATAARR